MIGEGELKMVDHSIEAVMRGSLDSTVYNGDRVHGVFSSGQKLGLGRIELIVENSTLIKIIINSSKVESNFSHHILLQAKNEIIEFLLGERQEFTLPTHLEGTEFQKRVWQAMRKIPYGELKTYGELAADIGNPKAARAIGGAANKNPLPLIYPCHRVIGAGGLLVGFAPGMTFKRTLLALEGHKINENSVV